MVFSLCACGGNESVDDTDSGSSTIQNQTDDTETESEDSSSDIIKPTESTESFIDISIVS